MKLLLPVAGKSSRFSVSRPKWLLTMPDGSLMIEKSIEGINLENINEIILIMLREHLKFISEENIKKTLEKKSQDTKVSIEILDNPTSSQPATIAQYLRKSNVEFKLFIKDCDNFFKFSPKPGNVVAYVNLDDMESVRARALSYIISNNFDEIEQIVEKKVISDKFCCGGYGFDSSKEFLNYYEKVGGDDNKDLYISHVIQKMLLDGSTFHAYKTSEFEDYGTLLEFQKHTNKTRSIFCDFDGVLVKNSSKFGNPPWEYKPMDNNLKFLSNYMKNSKYSKLIVTTSRPDSEKQNISKFLIKYDIKCHAIITSLPHSKRVLINDFSGSNPYPTAESINLIRDSDSMSEYF